MANRNVADDASNTNKATIHDDDRFMMLDSETGPDSLKEVLWSLIKSTIASATMTLTNKTLTTPTIGSFTNATHAHEAAASGGTLDEDALALTDVTTNNASTTKHGFLKKLSNVATEYLDGTGNWSTPAGGSGGMPKGYMHGLVLSNNATDATNDIDITLGKCRDSTDTVDMSLTAALTGKQLDAAWAVGSSAGFLDQGSIANATYHVHLIRRSDTGVVDAIASLSHDKSAVVTMTIASPGVVTWGVTGKGHGLVAGSPFKFSTTGALPTGVTAGTQYYVISTGLTETTFQFSASNGGAAVNTSGTQSGVHTGLPGPQMPTSYDSFRRVGSIVRTGAALKAFLQEGDNFMWKVPVADVTATNPGTSAVTRTLTLPIGIRTEAIVGVYGQSNGVTTDWTQGVYLSDLSITDTAVTGGAFSVFAYVAPSTGTTSGLVGGQVRVNTNMSAQIRSRIQQSGTNTILGIITLGWVDSRGRLA